MTDTDRVARATLSLASRPGSKTIAALVDSSGLVEAVAELNEKLRERDHPGFTMTDGARALERAESVGIRFIVPADAEWPPGLGALESRRFANERGFSGCLGLWVVSESPLDELVERSIGVVGTRTPTSCGTHVATELGHGLADAGWATVSGAAYGVDAAAHRGSLVGGSPTVAVLAGGADVRYPAGNASMLDRIAREGAIVSEVPPGLAPTRSRFLVRNRLIAALSVGTVIVEAGLRSGARNTIAHARSLPRVVMAVPGQVTSPMSVGSNLELKRGALAVMSAADVLEVAGKVGEHLQSNPTANTGVRDQLTSFESEVLDAVPVRKGRPSSLIARAADNKPVIAVGVALTRLEGLGLVSRTESGFVLTPRGRAPVASPDVDSATEGSGLEGPGWTAEGIPTLPFGQVQVE